MSRDRWPPGHVIHMSLRHHDERHTDSVAECDCGWVNLVEWPGHDPEQDEACEAHWQSVEKVGRSD